MNDPHVVALIYTITHGQSVDYSAAKPMDHEEPDFHVKIANEKVRFEFKKRHATVEPARRSIEEYICAWEVAAGLKGGANCFQLKYDDAQIEDRNPTPGVAALNGSPLRSEVTISKADITLSLSHYPSPPSRMKITPDVQLMYDRYMNYLQDRDPLTSMAYFCWTMVKDNPTTKTDFSRKVCHTIGRLSQGGGPKSARKREGIDKEPLTDQDCRFLIEAIKAIILRASERAHDPDSDLPQISMSDLPAPSSESRTQRQI